MEKLMEEIQLIPMSRDLCHAFYRGFANDPDIFMDMGKFYVFEYDSQWADNYFDRQAARGRLLFAVMLEGRPIGEVKLWDIDRENRECKLGIHLQSDAVKGRGFGTRAERLAVEYAFDELGLDRVWADAILKNTRSQHVLEKAGFRFHRQEGNFRWYCCDKRTNDRM